MSFETREAWLHAAAEKLAPLIRDAGFPDFALPRVSCGFAPAGAQKNIGFCVSGEATADKKPQVYVSPVLGPNTVGEECGVLATLLHELCHAALPDNVGHGKKFQVLAKDVGLEPPWTATAADQALREALRGIAKTLGPYPHAEIDLGKKKTQTTRMIKCECQECGYTCRTTKMWLLQDGAPLCPCNTEPMSWEKE